MPRTPDDILEAADREVSDEYRDLDQNSTDVVRSILGLRSTIIDCTEALIVAMRRGVADGCVHAFSEYGICSECGADAADERTDMAGMDIELTPEDERFLDRMVESGEYEDRSAVIRAALDYFFSPEGVTARTRLGS